MRILILTYVIFLGLICQAKPIKTNSTFNNNQDSIMIAKASLGFYDWYLHECIDPNYDWQDSIPILKIDSYINQLKQFGFISDNFIASEKERFQLCQDSLNTIDYNVVSECGCSAGEFFEVCYFLDYIYWISTQERYDGCEVKEIRINKNEAIAQLNFYWNSDNAIGKAYSDNFICKVKLIKDKDKWLIYSIDRYNE